MSLRRMRSGELIALAGAICLIVALALPWYENSQGKLSAWATFGVAVALLILAAAGALVLAIATVTERTAAIPSPPRCGAPCSGSSRRSRPW